jgi:hypothetical protein
VVDSGRSIIIIINIGAVDACDDCKFCSEHETREIQISEWNLHSFLLSTSLVRRKLSAFWENTRQDFLPLVRSSVYLFSEKMIVVEGKSGVYGCQFHGQKLHKRLETTWAGYFSRQIYPTESCSRSIAIEEVLSSRALRFYGEQYCPQCSSAKRRMFNKREGWDLWILPQLVVEETAHNLWSRRAWRPFLWSEASRKTIIWSHRVFTMSRLVILFPFACLKGEGV